MNETSNDPHSENIHITINFYPDRENPTVTALNGSYHHFIASTSNHRDYGRSGYSNFNRKQRRLNRRNNKR